jgi:hypothetical protein
MLVLYWYWHGTAGGAVQRGAVREGFVGGVVAVAVAVCSCSCSCGCAARPCLVSMRDKCLSLPPFPLCPALLCSACFFSLLLFFCLDLCNLQIDRCMTRSDIRSKLPFLILATLLWPLYQLCLRF